MSEPRSLLQPRSGKGAGSWFVSIPKFLLCCMTIFPLQSAQAMITVTETGARFASRTDQHYGPPIKKGYKYPARMQFVDGNLDLCPNPSNNRTRNLIVPYDGLAIALLVRSGGCSLREKENYIKTYLNIPNYVAYLIMDVGPVEEEKDDEWSLERVENLISDVITNGEDLIDHELHLDNEIGAADTMIADAEEESLLDRTGSRDQTTVPQRILHVSSRTHFELLDLLMRQSKQSYESGGVKIEMDSRLGTTVLSSSSAMWIAFSALMGACCCSCILIVTGQWVDDAPPPPPNHPNMRPQRRRLTKEQVKRMFPIYQFNGESLEPLVDEMVALAAPSTAENGDVLQAFVPSPLELECCSICLDEYEAGDRLRCLDPCHHAFHSACIGRWLSERSATCPLCKTELYDPQEEEDDSSEEEPPQRPSRNNNRTQESARAAGATATFFASFNPRQVSLTGSTPLPVVTASDEEAPLIVAATPEERLQVASPTATFELSDNASMVAEHRRPWLRTFRRWFSRSSNDNNASNTNMEDTTISLTQPLIEVDRPVSPTTGGEGNLMMPLESTLNNDNTTTTTTSILVGADSTVVNTTTPTTAENNNNEEPIPDPPGDHSRQITV